MSMQAEQVLEAVQAAQVALSPLKVGWLQPLVQLEVLESEVAGLLPESAMQAVLFSLEAVR